MKEKIGMTANEVPGCRLQIRRNAQIREAGKKLNLRTYYIPDGLQTKNGFMQNDLQLKDSWFPRWFHSMAQP